MSPFPLTAVTTALQRAGLLVRADASLPEQATNIVDDSRAVTPGALFIAIHGAVADGHDYLPQAAANGAAAAIVEDEGRTALPVIVVRDGRRAAAIAAAAAFAEPARLVRLAAVTGTNGKTTTVGLLRHLLDERPGPSGSIGTLGVLIGKGIPLDGGAGLTTPGPVELQRVLRAFVDAGVERIAMEVSSHSLDQRRVDGLMFEAAVFTNLTRDHLDYHKTMEAYFQAKARLVSQILPNGAAVVNVDDPAWRELPPAPRTITFGMSTSAAVRASGVRYMARGSEWMLEMGGERHIVRLPLIGAFNVSNALGAAAAAWHMGIAPSVIATRLQRAPQVPGRLELLHQHPTVLRDYAHTPDSLERALDAVRPFATRRLIVVFGCGGDRDRGKRPMMGEIAGRLADLTILTSDNPRTEDPERILDEIETGIGTMPHERVEDRRTAIARALSLAEPDDVILLAGKGHETYQIRGTTKYPFDEKVIVQELTRAGGRA
ncbi:MAG TPA: UDP-N-acetylmuramoyl-L-alanyl-D-glutamate--2,6-diaminopimelate ligase [Gemmatimonadaceae bacterium]|nr:UDP-N-acetylmuramoyl-L-alanyl-D-glutamate--2,6-diaminopimelate ligase [Gemmatimonadaceae bacterium]